MIKKPHTRLHLDRLELIDPVLQRASESKQFAGAAWAVVLEGEVQATGVVGSPTTDPELRMSLETIFDLASLTKPVATATSILFLLDRAELSAADEVKRYFPEAGVQWEGITLRQLLTHTSGLPPYAPLYTDHTGVDAIREGILELPMNASPGTHYDYSCLGYIMLQNIVQTVTGQSLAAFSEQHIFGPLGMKNTGYCPNDIVAGRAAVGGDCPHRGRFLRGEVHDPLAWAAGGVSGNAGLFSTAVDVGRWAATILAGGIYETYRCFSPASARLMLTNQLDRHVGGQTFGLFAVPNGMLPRGELLPDSTVGHTGFTGTSVVLVPEFQLAAVLLTNSLAHGSDKTEFFRTRRLFHTLVGAAVCA